MTKSTEDQEEGRRENGAFTEPSNSKAKLFPGDPNARSFS